MSEEEPEQEFRHCPTCHAPHSGTPKFCAECGENLWRPNSAPTSPPTPVPAVRRGVSGVLVGVVAALVLLVGVGLAAVLASTGEKPEALANAAQASEPTSTPTATPTPDEDTDGDGMLDSVDPDPYVDDSVDELDDAPSQDEEELADYEDEETTDQKSVRVGDAAVDDDVTFKVRAIEAVQSIPVDEWSDPIVRRKGTKLIRVDLTYKNNTGDGIDPFCGGGSIVLLDQDQRNFDPLDNYLEIAGNEICGDDLQPGFKRDVTLAFELPRDSKTGGVVLWNKDAEDDFSGELSNVFVSKS